MTDSLTIAPSGEAPVPAGAGAEKRREIRFNIYLPLMLRASGDGGFWCKGYTVNLSRSGAFILSRHPWGLESEIDVFMKGTAADPAAARKMVLVRARVVRIENPGDLLGRTGAAFALGIAFCSERDRSGVDSLIGSCIVAERYGPDAAGVDGIRLRRAPRACAP